MAAGHSNVYDDAVRADAYARLEFPGTYYLAYRDLPAVIREHMRATLPPCPLTPALSRGGRGGPYSRG